LQALEALAHSRQITLRNELPPDLVVFGDPTLLGEVLANLLGNAVKFGRPGDVVTLGVDADGRSLVVRDTGPGFAATRAARARAPSATIGSGDTGLGLRYSGEIMLAHGGRLEVDGQLETGARVVMRLPQRGAVVLVADDQPAQRQLIAEAVRQALPEVTVVEVEDGQQAWNSLEAVRPDGLVADVQMPVRDGLALVRAMRDDARWQHLPVLMVSSAPQDAQGRPMQAACLEAGADAFLPKPLDPAAFAPLMKTLMQVTDDLTDNEGAAVRPLATDPI
jgi:CheY-like chemotaxis protein